MKTTVAQVLRLAAGLGVASVAAADAAVIAYGAGTSRGFDLNAATTDPDGMLESNVFNELGPITDTYDSGAEITSSAPNDVQSRAEVGFTSFFGATSMTATGHLEVSADARNGISPPQSAQAGARMDFQAVFFVDEPVNFTFTGSLATSNGQLVSPASVGSDNFLLSFTGGSFSSPVLSGPGAVSYSGGPLEPGVPYFLTARVPRDVAAGPGGSAGTWTADLDFNFEITPVPEPGGWAAAGAVALLGWAGLWRRWNRPPR